MFIRCFMAIMFISAPATHNKIIHLPITSATPGLQHTTYVFVFFFRGGGVHHIEKFEVILCCYSMKLWLQ